MEAGVEQLGFSIIIPVKAINNYIRESVPITLALDYPAFEIIILPNELSEAPLEPALKDPRVRIIPSGRVSPAVKRDLGAAQSRYPLLAFIDDDAYPAVNWLQEAARHFAREDIAAIGGPAITPPDSNLREKASGLFYETITGGGGMAFRYLPADREFLVDDFPTVNLLVRKSAFNAIGGFDSGFWPGEDTKFCHDLVKAGFKILYVPSVVVWHHRRQVFRGHLRQIAGYGRHRGYFAKILPLTSRRPVYFAPSLFVVGHLALIGLSLVHSFFFALWLFLTGLYIFLVAIDVVARTRHLGLFALTFMVIPVSHVTYGIMFIRGYFSQRKFESQLR